jgi:formyl-CoA transferase
MGQKLPQLIGNAHPNLAPYDLFQTKTRPIFLGVGNEGQFRKAMSLLGKPELADDPRFNTVAKRNANRVELTQILAEIFANLDGVALTRNLLEAGVPAGTLNSVAEALTEPQTKVRGMVLESGSYKGVGSPIKLSRNKASLRHTPPRFNQDGRAVLKDFGLSEKDIETLIQDGAMPTKRKT